MDLEDLDHLVSDYFRHFELAGSSSREDRLAAEAGDPLDDWLRDALVTRAGAAPDESWTVLVHLVDMAPNDDALGIVAAGPLADMLSRHADEFGERLVEQMRRDKRFRETVGLIHHWEGVPSLLRERLEALTG
jgi:Family of unknown function (DUF6869)